MIDFIKATFTEFGKDRCTTLGAALAYYTIFSLPPMIFLLVTVVSLTLSTVPNSKNAEENAEKVVEQQVEQVVGNDSASEVVGTMLDERQDAGGNWWKSLLSLGGILFGATGVVAALQDSLNRVWEIKTDPEEGSWFDIIKKRILSLGMIVSLGFILVVSLLLTTALTAAGEKIAGSIGIEVSTAYIISSVVQFLISWFVFAAIFKFMPDAVVKWTDVAIGGLITAVLFLIGRIALQWYLGTSEPGAQFGSAAASLVVLLVWVYYTALIVLYGAEVTQQYAVRYGDGIQPQRHAVRYEETIKRPDSTSDDDGTVAAT